MPKITKDIEGFHRSESLHRYVLSFISTVLLFIFFSFYIYNRRGYYDLYILNKIFAGIAATQIGIILLIGSLSRMFDVFDKLLQFRKSLGIFAFLMVSPHVISSLFLLRDHFPLERYFTTGSTPFIFGLLATIVLIILFFISNKKTMEKIGFKTWWKIQNWGIRITFFGIAGHVFFMKLPSWQKWYVNGGNRELARPDWPGLGMLIGWFMAFVIVIRIAEAINPRIGRLVWYTSIALLPLIYLFTFYWGFQFA